MPKLAQTTVRCPSCGQPFNITLQTFIDVAEDPDAKIRLLSGRWNVAQCPNCGTSTAMATPLLYHDSSKELLVAYIPMELNLRQDDHEKIIGELMRQLPKESFKGYMFQPRRALTMQGLVDQILEADGVTREALDKQRARVKLAQTFVETSDEDLPALVEQYDAEIDAQFFQTLSMMAQRVLQDGRPDLAEQIILTQSRLVELSTFGRQLMQQREAQEQIVREVAAAIESLGQEADRSDFLDLAIQYADDEQRLQALVGLVRPAFDYTFFQELTMRVGQAPAAERDALEALRERLLALTAMIDQQAQMALQNAVGLLQTIVNSPNPEEIIAANLPVIDDTFMAVLSANIQEAEKRKDLNAVGRLKHVYDQVISQLQENMKPELRFVNELLSTETEEDARTMIAERAGEFGEDLLDVMDGLGEVLASQGENTMLEKLAFLRKEAADALN